MVMIRRSTKESYPSFSPPGKVTLPGQEWNFRIERLLGVPEKHLEFHIWYLKEKGWIQRDESGGYAITANGVDTVLQNDLPLKKNLLLPLEKETIGQAGRNEP
jgi:hypothetical protein